MKLATSRPPITGDRVRLEPDGDTLAIVRVGDGARIGKVSLRDEQGVVTIDALCVDAEFRGYGAGSDAAWLLADALAAGGAHVLRAWAPPDRGLAVYFWSRMGFHPLHGPGPNGGIWFERRLA